ncbi:MAG: histone-like nucleoid-structuring protein Lsr2 [Actinomycetes bacterium]
MAQKVQVILVDDVDGGAADETVTFALDGVSYEIDLNDDNATALRDSLARWIGHARRVAGRSTSRRGGGRSGKQAVASSNGGGPSNTEIRDWARENGHEVSDRGRISAQIREAYAAAHGER